MVSLKHEGLAKLVRDRPAFAADLLGGLLAVKVPPFSKAQLVDVTLNQVRRAEYRADAVVLFTRNKPVFEAIVEVQLRPKKQKAVLLAAVRGRCARERAMPVRGAGVDTERSDREVGVPADRAGRAGTSTGRWSSGPTGSRSSP